MTRIPPAIPDQSPSPADPQDAATPDNEAPPRSPVSPESMHRAEDDAAARARSRDFGDDAPKPSADE